MKLLTVTEEDFAALRQKILQEDEFGGDYETTADRKYKSKDAPLELDKLEVAGFGMGFMDGSFTYIPVWHSDICVDKKLFFDFMTWLMGLKDKVMWAHNSKFEIMVTNKLLIEQKIQWRCSQIAQFMANKGLGGGRGLKLKPAVLEYLGHQMTTIDEVLGSTRRMHEVPASEVADYGGEDALYCLKLGKYLQNHLEKFDLMKPFIDLECAFTPVIVHMQEVGMAIDRDRLTEIGDALKKEMDELAIAFKELTGAKISSDQQVAQRMYVDLKWWPIFPWMKPGKKGYYSVNKDHRAAVAEKLEKGTKPWVAMELKSKYQSVSKLQSTYTHRMVQHADKYGDGRVRSNISQTIAATGRLSSSAPNLQNIPSHGEGVVIREAFVAAPGWKLGLADYSQADLVMMAHLSQDPMLMHAYRTGIDVHQQTADMCNCDRPTGKVLNLGLIYEMGEETLAANLGISVARASIIYNAWHRSYPGVKRYQKRMHQWVKRDGYVKTITGRVRFLPDIYDKRSWVRAAAEREASNTPDQGSVADVIKIAMRNLYRAWKESGVLYNVHTGTGCAKILLQVHDEIIVEATEEFIEQAVLDVQYHMENAVKLSVPMTAGPGVGDYWLAAKKDSGVREKMEAELKKQEAARAN